MAKGTKTGGRKKGAQNKLTTELKEMILTALDEAGGINYLKVQATESPGAFLSLIGKVLPTTLANDPKNPVSVPIFQLLMNDPNNPEKTSR